MVDIEIGKKCILTHNDGTRQIFEPGKHVVPPDVAEHWWIKAHLRDAPPAVPKIGSIEYALMARAAAEKAVADAQAMADKAAELQAAADNAAKSILAASGGAATAEPAGEPPAAEPEEEEPVLPPKRGPGRPPKSSYPVASE